MAETLSTEAPTPRATDFKDYTLTAERLVGLHSAHLLRLALGRHRKNLANVSVLELGAGPYTTFGRRAESVTKRGGTYMALEINPLTVEGATAEIKERIKLGKEGLRQAHIEQGNANILQIDLIGTQDAIIVNRIGGGSTLRACLQMLTDLQQLSKSNPSPSVQKALDYLQKFVKGIDYRGLDDDGTFSGSNKHILVAINAFLMLKDGGKLVFAHNDQNMMHMNSIQLRMAFRDIGFTNVTITDPFYNLITATELPHVVRSKFRGRPNIRLADYEVVILSAEKPSIYTSEAFL